VALLRRHQVLVLLQVGGGEIRTDRLAGRGGMQLGPFSSPRCNSDASEADPKNGSGSIDGVDRLVKLQVVDEILG